MLLLLSQLLDLKRPQSAIFTVLILFGEDLYTTYKTSGFLCLAKAKIGSTVTDISKQFVSLLNALKEVPPRYTNISSSSFFSLFHPFRGGWSLLKLIIQNPTNTRLQLQKSLSPKTFISQKRARKNLIKTKGRTNYR